MKVVLANKFYYRKGGAERYVFSVQEHMQAMGYSMIPFAMQHPENEATPFSVYFPSYVQTSRLRFGWQGLRTFGRMLYSIEARRNMAQLLTDIQPDVCHIHNIYTQISPSVLHALKERRIPTVMTVHDHHLISPQYNPWAPDCGPSVQKMNLFQASASRFHKRSFAASFLQTAVFRFHQRMRWYRRFVDLFLCPSEYMAERLILDGFPEEQVRVLPYGLDVKSYQPHYEHEGYALFVGRLAPEKGVSTVMRLARMMPEMTFKIVGTGPDEAAIHHVADPLKNVELLGYQTGERLRRLYQGAMCVLVPSRVNEVFGFVPLEAMASGTPVIASHVGAIDEVVEDRHSGYLVRPLDLAGWLEALLRLRYDTSLHKRLARSARETVERRFDADRHFARLDEIYEEMAEKRG